jgi:hypothetical protein
VFLVPGSRNRPSGTVSRDLLREAEEFPDDDADDEELDLSDGEDQEWEIAKRIVLTDRFRKLPSKFEVNEWQIMEDFSLSVKSDRIREDLLDAIQGRGAFRYFKDTCGGTEWNQHGVHSARRP